MTISTNCIPFGDGSIDSAAVAEIADTRAVIEQAKGMPILLYGVDDESAFDMLRRRSQSTNVKLRAPAGQQVSDYRALSNGETLPPRWVYEKTLMIIHERIARDRSDSPVASLVHREPDRPPESLIGRPPSVLEPRRRVTAKRGDGWLRPNPDEG